MRSANPLAATLLIFLLLFALVLPRPAQATLPVWDYIQYVLQLIKWIWEQSRVLWNQAKIEYAQYQRVQMIYQQARQIELQLQALKSWGRSGDFSTLNGAMGEIDSLFNQIDGLGYLTRNIYQRWRETFPGLVPPLNWQAEQKARLERARLTVEANMRALNRLSENQTHAQVVLLQLGERARQSDSPQTQLEVSNMYNQAMGLELTKLTMTTSIIAATASHAFALQVQTDSSALAAREAWLSGPLPDPRPSLIDQFTGLPSSFSLNFPHLP